nr:hypothetical protein [Acidobacteriota bacterium]
MAGWHIVTSEYPPQPGGVSDYTRLVAEGLARRGEEVHVWCPRRAGVDEGGVEGDAGAPGVSVHRACGSFSPADLRRLGRSLGEYRAPRRLLVQYVPHGYGYRSMNAALCLWLWKRAALDGDEVEIVAHEPFLAFGEGSRRQDAVALVHRLMTALLLRAAGRVWATIPAWAEAWRPYALGRRVRFEVLPVPSTIPVLGDPARTSAARSLYARPGGVLVGHLGTYSPLITRDLRRVLPPLLARHESASALLLGRGGEEERDEIVRRHPSLGGRVHAAGYLPARELSAHLSACDLMLQP